MTNRIACTAMTGRIVQGRVNKAGTDFTGKTKDVTSDVLKAVIDKLERHGGKFDITAGGKVVASITLTKPEQREKVELTAHGIDCAATILAVAMDYPWAQMPEEGRNNMRRIAKAVAIAASAKQNGGEG